MSVLGVYADGAVFGARSGDGPPNVLLLHGWRKTHADMARVAAGFDAISIDLPGFGASPQPTELWGASDFADAIAPVLDELARPTIVVGHSFGGRIAVQLAARHRDRIDGLVLTGAPLIRKQSTAPKTPFAFRVAKFANRIGIVSDTRMEAERKKRGSADYRAADGLMRDIFVKLVNESYEAELAKITCRVEMVWGADDAEAPLTQAREATTLLGNAYLTVVEDGSHWMPAENPEPLRAAIAKLVTEIG